MSYGERFVVVYQEQVVGVGDSRPAAIADAEKKLDPQITEITPLVYQLHQPEVFFPKRY